MNKTIAKVFSWVFNPLILPTYMAFIIMKAHPQQFPSYSELVSKQSMSWDVKLLAYFMLSFFIPAFSLFVMKKLDLLDSFVDGDDKKRFIPLIGIATLWLWTYFMFKEDGQYFTSSYAPLGQMTLGCIVSIFIMFPLNFVTKINWHMIGMGALVNMLMNIVKTSQVSLIVFILMAILIGGIVASAQITLHKSKREELIYGVLIGFFGQFFAFQIWSMF